MSGPLHVTQFIIIDDDEDQASLFERALRKGNYQSPQNGQSAAIRKFDNPTEAITELPTEGPVVVICDYNLSESTGLDWLPHLVKEGLGPVIMASSQGDERIASEAFKAGASDYLVKMDVFQDPSILHQAIREGLLQYKLERSNHDLSRKLKNANIALQSKNERLRELTETAHRFVEDVAHEFRTPLTVIKEFASLIKDGLGGEVTGRQVEFLGHIETSVTNLANLVDDFLDTSKLRAKLMRVDRREHAVEDLFCSVRAVLSTRAASKSIRFSEYIQPGLPPVFCDREKAGRVIINLAINAFKFSEDSGEVELWARKHSDGGVEIGVTDHGPGITEDDLAKLGNRLTQTGAGQRCSVKGFGLGLNIAMDLVRVNLGRMNVSSRYGQGSTFAFTLPRSDRADILDHYFDTVAQQSPELSLTTLQATPIDQNVDIEKARQFLASNCQSFDLLLPDSDGRSVVLVGPTNEPDSWVRSLQKHIEQSRSQMKIDSFGVDMNIRWVGTWSTPQSRSAIVTSVTQLLQGVRNCA